MGTVEGLVGNFTKGCRDMAAAEAIFLVCPGRLEVRRCVRRLLLGHGLELCLLCWRGLVVLECRLVEGLKFDRM